MEKSLRATATSPPPLPLGQIGNFVGQEAMPPVDCEIVAPPVVVHVAQEDPIDRPIRAEIRRRLAQMALVKEQPPQRRIVTLPPAEVDFRLFDFAFVSSTICCFTLTTVFRSKFDSIHSENFDERRFSVERL